MRITVSYGGREYPLQESDDNIEALRQVGQYVSVGRSENLILTGVDGSTLILVVGPGIPFAVTYSG